MKTCFGELIRPPTFSHYWWALRSCLPQGAPANGWAGSHEPDHACPKWHSCHEQIVLGASPQLVQDFLILWYDWRLSSFPVLLTLHCCHPGSPCLPPSPAHTPQNKEALFFTGNPLNPLIRVQCIPAQASTAWKTPNDTHDTRGGLRKETGGKMGFGGQASHYPVGKWTLRPR